MSIKWFLGSILAVSAFGAPAQGQISIMIGTPPPPIRYEAVPVMPEPGYVWTPGYWAPVQGQYVWYSGRWARPPYYGAAWRSPRWVHEDRGWRYQRGDWDRHERREWREDHHDHGHGHAYGHYK